MLSGCVPKKTHKKKVELPARLTLDGSNHVTHDRDHKSDNSADKNIKSGMAYKPATFLFGKAQNLGEYGEYEDIPLPIGVENIQYQAANRSQQESNPGSFKRNAFDRHRLAGASNWCDSKDGESRCSGDSALSYVTAQSVEQLANFYVCNMERLGWQLVADFYAHETLFFFERYDKRCTVSLRPEKKSTQVIIFVSLRTALQ
jgi:hypothetical protein